MAGGEGHDKTHKKTEGMQGKIREALHQDEVSASLPPQRMMWRRAQEYRSSLLPTRGGGGGGCLPTTRLTAHPFFFVFTCAEWKIHEHASTRQT